MAKRLVGVDLFAGAGGMSLGFEQAGMDVLAAVEVDPIHCAVHKYNFPDCAVLPQSVSDLTGKDIQNAIGGKKVDVVFGGAPCQGFSLIGQRILDDPRNSLVKDFLRIVCELDASWFVFENVKGLTVGKHRRFLDELIEAFEVVGYDVRQPWRVLNAVNYGVPQSRERLILMGAKKGLPLPLYPASTHIRAGIADQLIGKPGPSCEDALGDLPDAEKFQTLIKSDSVAVKKWGEESAYAREMRCRNPKSFHLGYRRKWDPMVLTSSIRTNHSEISRSRFLETEPGDVEPISRFFRLPKNGVSNTLRAGTDAARGAFTSPRPIHYKYGRCVTVREMARLHGFPDWFRLHSTKWHGARQVGNSVPPPLARAIAAMVVEAAGILPSQPDNVVELGDQEFLTMDMTEAARYWGVRKPTSKRDRKSGAKKRSQEETEAARIAARV